MGERLRGVSLRGVAYGGVAYGEVPEWEWLVRGMAYEGRVL